MTTSTMTSSAPPTPKRRRLATLAGAVLIILTTTINAARAHTRDEVDELIAELQAELIQRIEYDFDGGINLGLLKWFRAELEATEALYTPPSTRTATSRSYTVGEAAAVWRPVVAAHFPANQVNRALAVIWCESKGNPNAANPRSSARGLFQHLERYWPARSSKAGYAGASILNPEANTAVAAYLVRTSGWHHWRNCP